MLVQRDYFLSAVVCHVQSLLRDTPSLLMHVPRLQPPAISHPWLQVLSVRPSSHPYSTSYSKTQGKYSSCHCPGLKASVWFGRLPLAPLKDVQNPASVIYTFTCLAVSLYPSPDINAGSNPGMQRFLGVHSKRPPYKPSSYLNAFPRQ